MVQAAQKYFRFRMVSAMRWPEIRSNRSQVPRVQFRMGASPMAAAGSMPPAVP